MADLVSIRNMANIGMLSALGTTLQNNDFTNSTHAIDVADYDGTVTYEWVIVASNSDSGARDVVLKIVGGATVATISVPAGVTNERYSTSITLSGSNSYLTNLMRTTSTNQLGVSSSRIMIKQIGATKTVVAIPLVGSITNSGSAVGTVGSTTSATPVTPSSSNHHYFKWVAANWATVSAIKHMGVGRGTAVGTGVILSLFTLAGVEITNSEVTITGNVPQALLSNDFLADITNNETYETRVEATAGGTGNLFGSFLMVYLNPLTKGEVWHRIIRGSGNNITTATAFDANRHKIDLADFSGTLTHYLDGTGREATLGTNSLNMHDAGTADTGTTGTDITPGLEFNSTTKGYTRFTLGSTVDSGDRVYGQVLRTTGTVNAMSLFYTVAFDDTPSVDHTYDADDTVTPTEAAVKTAVKNFMDSATSSDTNTKAVTASKSDTATVSDANANSPSKSASDTSTASDTAIKNVGANKADTASASDATAKTASLAKADSVTASDATAKSATKAASNTATASDSAAKAVTANKSDSTTPTDNTSKAATLNKTDSVTITDLTAKLLTIIKVDTATASDLMSKAAALAKSDTATATDEVSKSGSISLEDAASLTDAVSKSSSLSKADSVAVTDILSKIVDYIRSLEDTATVSDVAVTNFIQSLRQVIDFTLSTDNNTISLNSDSSTSDIDGDDEASNIGSDNATIVIDSDNSNTIINNEV